MDNTKTAEELRKENEKLNLRLSLELIAKTLAEKEIERLKESNKQLEEWKREQIEVTKPIFDWGHSQKDLTVGTSIVGEILKRLEEHKVLKESNKELVDFCKWLNILGGKGLEVHKLAKELIQKSEGRDIK